MSTLEPTPGTPVPNLNPGAVSGFQAVTLRPPTTLAALQGWGPNKITGQPATAWTTGQQVTLGDGTKAHWTGSAWVVGPA